MALMYGMFSQGSWKDERGVNVLDTGAPWYDTYETKDGKWLAVGAIEAALLRGVRARGWACRSSELPKQHDRKGWPELRQRFADSHRVARRATSGSASSRAATPASRRCCRLREVAKHPHNAARGTFADARRRAAAGPAPRFSRTEPEMGRAPQPAGADTRAVLARLRVRCRRRSPA